MKYKYKPNNHIPYTLKLTKEEAKLFTELLLNTNNLRYKLLVDQLLDALDPNTPGK